MIPSSIGAIFLLVALVPGWLHLRLRERLAPPSGATGLSELLEVLAVGLATTGASVMILVFLPSGWLPFLVDLDTWAAQGETYIRQHVRDAVASVGGVLALAMLIAYLFYLPLRLRRPAEFRAQGSVWVHALGARRKKQPWVSLQMKDGTLVEGMLQSFSLSEGGLEERDVALQRPIRVTTQPGQMPQWLKLDRFIVPGSELSYITVIHVSKAK